MSRSKRYTQNGAERIASTLRSVSCLCATDGGRPLHPPSADENEMRGTRRRAAVCAPVCVHGEITLVCVTRLPVCVSKPFFSLYGIMNKVFLFLSDSDPQGSIICGSLNTLCIILSSLNICRIFYF